MKKSNPFTTFFTLSVLCSVAGIAFSSTFFPSDRYFLLFGKSVSLLRIMFIVQFFSSVIGSSVLKKRQNPMFFVFLSSLISLVVAVYSGFTAFATAERKTFDYIIPLFSLVVLIFGIIVIASCFTSKDADDGDCQTADPFVKGKDETAFSEDFEKGKVVETSVLPRTCTQCGARTEVSGDGKRSRCPYCGTRYKVKDRDEFFD